MLNKTNSIDEFIAKDYLTEAKEFWWNLCKDGVIDLDTYTDAVDTIDDLIYEQEMREIESKRALKQAFNSVSKTIMGMRENAENEKEKRQWNRVLDDWFRIAIEKGVY